MTTAEKYRAEAERARQMGRDAQKNGDALLIGKPNVSPEDQKAGDEHYVAMRKAFKRAIEWDERAVAEEQEVAREHMFRAQQERNRLPMREPASKTDGKLLNEVPTAVELMARQLAVVQEPLSDMATKRWPVENLLALAIREQFKPGVMSADQRKAWADYQLVAREARVRLALTPTQKADTDSLGGVLVPDYFDRMIRDEATYEGPLADDTLISTLTVNGPGTMNIPVNENIQTVDPRQVDEGTDVPIQDTDWTQVELVTRAFDVQMVLTDQILQADVISIEPYLARKVGENFGRKQNAFFTAGTGAANKQPKGILSVASGRRVDSTQKTTVTEDDVNKLRKKLSTGVHRKRGTRFMTTQAVLFDMMVARESAGGNLIWQRTPDGLGITMTASGAALANDNLPAPTANAVGIAVLANLSDYTKLAVGGLYFERQRELRSKQWVLHWGTYLDGSPIIESDYAILKASA